MPSTDDVENLRYIRSLSQDNVPLTLDFSDDRQWAFFINQVHASGVTAESHPQFYKSLLESRERHIANGGPTATPEALYGPAALSASADETNPPLVNTNDITSLAIDNTQSYSFGSAYSAIVGGTVSTWLGVVITDLQQNQLGSGSVGPIYGMGEYIPITTTGNTPPTTGLQMQYTYHYQVQGQFPVQQTVRRAVLDQPVGPPTVEQPVKQTTNPQHPTYIKIGIGRDRQHTPFDCDYYYYETNIENPNLRCPAVGHQTFGSAILQPLFDNGSPTSNLIVSIAISQTHLGGAVTLPINMANIANYITASGNTLYWNFVWNSNLSLDTSMLFGSAAWARDTTVMLNFSLGVLTQQSPTVPVWVNIISLPAGAAGSPPSEGNWGTSPGPGNYIMWPLFYTWHCVAAGTKVRLADGSTAAIESLRGGEKVKNGPGDDVFTVVDTWGNVGEYEMVSLEADGCDKLLVTPEHGVMTPKGLVHASDLATGDVVLTEKGKAKLTRVAKEPYDGLVCIFSVGADESEVARFQDDNTCFYANGILIADHRATLIHERERRYGLERVLSRIPPEWHEEARRWYPQQRQELAPIADLGITR